MPSKEPIIALTPITKRWVCITKYRLLKSGLIEASEKHDVHEQIIDIIRKHGAKKPAKTLRTGRCT